jgi:sulfite reductase (ferredoxin)
MDKVLPAAEKAKLDARFLRGTLAEELANSAPEFSKPAMAVLKFHGTYQQDDRDLRKAGVKQITSMVRVGVPGGVLSPDQYLTLDRVADLAGKTLRITTRQDIQFHYVPKSNIRELMRSLNENYLSTLAACGDVVRNVVSCPAPIESPERTEIQPYVLHLSKNLKPKTTAYYDIWIAGEHALSAEAPEPEDPFAVEPLYGATYLPRKFKIGFAFPGDNTTDVYSNDIGIVPRYANGKLLGFTILAGGGMGQSAGVKASHPRLADPVCDIPADKDLLLQVSSAIVSIHRDFGNRTNRKLARLKYVLDDWGVEKFKAELESRVGRPLDAPSRLEWHRSFDYLGWHRQTLNVADSESKWFVGVRIISGRIADTGGCKLRTGLREIVSRFRLEVRLTAQQNIYLAGISDQDRPEIAKLLNDYGLISAPASLPPVLRRAISCPALPTCALAITESERIMPAVVAEIQSHLDQAGLSDQEITLRTSGCPNGCSRPYTAEIGIVGASVDMYTVYLGAAPHGTRLGAAFAVNIKRHEVAPRLRPVLELYRDRRLKEESFGDFCYRVGIPALQEASAAQPQLA